VVVIVGRLRPDESDEEWEAGSRVTEPAEVVAGTVDVGALAYAPAGSKTTAVPAPVPTTSDQGRSTAAVARARVRRRDAQGVDRWRSPKGIASLLLRRARFITI
jgi:hypothetical protein